MINNVTHPAYRRFPKLVAVGPAPGTTPKDIEGPFYKKDAPFTGNAAFPDPPDFTLHGRVLNENKEPLAQAVVDVWTADKDGNYDNEGYNHRAKVMTGFDGRYEMLCIRPGDYKISDPGQPDEFRCAHVHVKVWVGGKCVLTTQLYFPDDIWNGEDRWFNPVMVIDPSAGAPTFDFVVKV